MDLSLLDTFRTVAEEGSFSRAGQKVGRTQPAVSLALKRLETELGVTLIDRGSKALALTDAGRLALEYCDRFEGLERELRMALAELRSLIEQHRQHTGSTVAQAVLEDWDRAVTRFKKVMPIDYKRALAELAAEEQELATGAADAPPAI